MKDYSKYFKMKDAYDFLVGEGYSKEVVNSRILTVVLIVGIVIGYLLSNFIEYFRNTGPEIM